MSENGTPKKRGGPRPNSGPKKGTKYKKTLDAELRTREMLQKATAEGKLQPLEVMLHCMQDAWRDYDAQGRTDEALRKQLSALAAEAAPYVHARLQSVDASVKTQAVVQEVRDSPMSPEQWEAKANEPDGFKGSVH